MGKKERRMLGPALRQGSHVTEKPGRTIQEETKMVIKVELADEKSRKKIDEVLRDFPQIQNKEYNEKDNMVLITVVCRSPEKVKEKPERELIGAMKPCLPPPPEPKEPEKPKPPPETLKEPDKKDKPKDAPKPPSLPPERVITVVEPPPPKAPGPAEPPTKAPEPAPKPHEPVPVAFGLVPIGYPPQPPVKTCWECYEGYGGGPCWGGYGGPSGPCYGKPVYDSWGGGYWRPIYPSRCTDYIYEENPNAACSIM